jgi:GTP-binding protein Era
MTMTTYCGYIALIGRANVGKSTLLNRILQTKISITSRKPQTTRHRILGICTEDLYQFIYVDTPGLHHGSQKALNNMMNKVVNNVVFDVDVIGFVVDASAWNEQDEHVLKLLTNVNIPVVLVINKVDKIDDKTKLLPWIEQISQRYKFAEVIPLSAKNGDQVDKLHFLMRNYLPAGHHLFMHDQLTDRPVKFLCAELLREKIFRLCGEELPYVTNVEIEAFTELDHLIRIHAVILVEKASHKRIIIGEKGHKLKEIASSARIDMEHLLNKKVFLQCWCKVKPGWTNDKRALKQLGYD